MVDLPRDVASRVPSAFVPESALVVSRFFTADPEFGDGVPVTPNRYKIESLASLHGTYPDVIAEAAAGDPGAAARYWPTAGLLSDHQHGSDPRESRSVVAVVQFGGIAAAEAAVEKLNRLYGDPWRHPNEPFQRDSYTSYGGQSELDRDLAVIATEGGVVIADVGLSNAMSRPDSRVGQDLSDVAITLEVMAPPAKLPDGHGVFVGLAGPGLPVTVRTAHPIDALSEGDVVRARVAGPVSIDGLGASLDAWTVEPALPSRLVPESDLRQPLDPLKGDSSFQVHVDAAALSSRPVLGAGSLPLGPAFAHAASRLPAADVLARYADAIVLPEVVLSSFVGDRGDGRGPVAAVDLVETGRFVSGQSAVALMRDVLADRPATVVRVDVDVARAAEIEQGLRVEAGRSIALGSQSYFEMRREFSSALSGAIASLEPGSPSSPVTSLKVESLDGGGHGMVGRNQVSQFIAKSEGKEVAVYAIDGVNWTALKGLSNLDGAASLSVVAIGSDHPGRAAFLVREVAQRHVVIAASHADVLSAVSTETTAQVPSPAVSLTLRNFAKAVRQPEFAPDSSGAMVRTGRILEGEDGLRSVLATFGSAAARKVYFDAATLGRELSRASRDARRLFSMALDVSHSRMRPPQVAAPAKRDREGASL